MDGDISRSRQCNLELQKADIEPSIAFDVASFALGVPVYVSKENS